MCPPTHGTTATGSTSPPPASASSTSPAPPSPACSSRSDEGFGAESAPKGSSERRGGQATTRTPRPRGQSASPPGGTYHAFVSPSPDRRTTISGPSATHDVAGPSACTANGCPGVSYQPSSFGRSTATAGAVGS